MEFASPQEALTAFKKEKITLEECLSVVKAFPSKLSIPRECFEEQTIQQQISNESDEKFELIGISFAEPISVLIKDAQFPLKTFVDPDMLGAANIVKSLFIEPIKLLSMWQYAPAVAYTALRRKDLEKMIESFNRIAWRVISPYILKDNYCTTFTPEFRKLIVNVLLNLGITEHIAVRFGKIVSHLLEYDNAYRLRLEDIFSETKKEYWKNPSKELSRLSKIFSYRDINPAVTKKVNQLVFLMKIALLVPKIRDAVKKSIDQCDLKNLHLDEVDTYWLTLRSDYKLRGMTFEQIKEYGKQRGWAYPNKL